MKYINTYPKDSISSLRLVKEKNYSSAMLGKNKDIERFKLFYDSFMCTGNCTFQFCHYK